MLTVIQQYPYLTIALSAFFLNVPIGYVREYSPRFSSQWFSRFYIAIPVIVYLHVLLNVSWGFIPAAIFIGVLGQIIGGYCSKQQMSIKDQEKLQQIPDLRLSSLTAKISDEEVMVVLLNMGGPKTNADVPDFLRRIFLDPHIIRFPLSNILQSFFAWMLVTVRAQTVAERYHLIGGGSPIYPSTENQVKALQQELDRRGRKLKVTYSFNYSRPLPSDTIAEIKASGKKYFLPVSMYPHYSKATTGSNLLYLHREADKKFPELQFLPVPSYYLHPKYIEAFVDRIRQQINPGESLDDFYILFSAHGLPLYFLVEGDPYPFQIAQTVACVLKGINRKNAWTISYQSDVGPLQWIKPSTENMLLTLARRGIKKILVVPIAFVNDHIETSCEIDIEYRKVAEDAGVTDFRMSKAIEIHPGFIQALGDAVEEILPKR